MAAENGKQAAAVIDQLFREPHRFDFYQAVLLLERMDRLRAEEDSQRKRNPVGHDYAPNSESVRFRASPSLSFPAGSISRVLQEEPDSSEHEKQSLPPEMTVSFMGLTGPSGVLPDHYTSLLIRRIREKDTSLRDFFDMFNHRIVSLFYRAWEKNHFPTAYERSMLDESAEDPVSQGLYSLIGLGLESQRRRSKIDDESLVFYGGFFSHGPPTADSLEAVLNDYFDVPVVIKQFQGQWMHLSEEDHSRLPGKRCPRGQYNRLGVDVVLGERVWDVQNKFRLRLGPLNYQQFRRFIPKRDALQPLCQLTRSYVGTQFDFDIQPILKAAEVPMLRLNTDGSDIPQLGWNTWLQSQLGVDSETAAHLAESESIGFSEKDVDDALFSSDLHE